MKTAPLHILIAEDDGAHVAAILRAFETGSLKAEVEVVGTLGEFRQRSAERPPDAAVMDLVFPDGRALELLACAPEARNFPILLMTSHGNEHVAVEAVKAGALDYVVKSPEAFAQMPHAVERVLREWKLLAKNKQAEENLRQSVQQYHLLANNVADVLWKFDFESRRFIYISPSVYRLCGYTVGEAMAQPLEQILTQESLALVNKILDEGAKAFRSGDPAAVSRVHEVEVIRKDGSNVWTEMTTTFFANERGGISVVGVSRDITERKQAETVRRESENQLRKLLEMVPVPLVYTNKDGVITFRNQRFTQLFGYTADEVPTLTEWWPRAYPDPQYRQWVIQTWSALNRCAVAESRDVEPAVYKITCKDGQVRDIEVSGMMVGEGLLAVFIDITERNRAEQVLRESEARLRTFNEANFDGIIVSERGTIVDLNRRMASLLGFEISELIGRKVVDIVTPEDQSLVQQVQAEGLESRYESSLISKDGSVVIVETQARHCIWSGRKMRVTALHDITARRKMEEQLKQLLKQLQAILDSAPIGIALTRGRNIQWSNSTHCAMFGYAAEEICGMDASALYVRTEDYERVGREASVMIPQGLYFTAEVELRRKSGVRFWCLIQGRAIDPKDLSAGAIWMLMDVTERKQAEEAIRKSEENFRSVIENAPVGIFQFTDDRVLVTNPAAARMFGYESPEEMIAQTVSPEALFAQPEQPRRLIREAMESGTYAQYEVENRRKDGSTFTANLWARTICDAAGDFKIMEGFIEDVTERKRAKAELLKMSRAIEQSPVTIVITDLAGNIEYVNPAFSRQTGYTREEALGKNPRMLNSGKMAREDYKILWDTILAGRDWRGEFMNKAKDGRLFWESAVISPIVNKAGQVTHFLAVKEDITQRKHLENQLRQAQKMEAIGQLAGGVAHDFNNILTATLMHLGLLQENPNLSAGTKESLKEVEKETMRATNLTRQLLLFGRRQSANVEELDLNERIGDLLKMLRRLLGENIGIATQFSSKGTWVKADAGMLEQVVMNLCINARDAMPGGGILTLGTTLVDLESEPAGRHPEARPGRFVCLSVTDTGCGMDQTVLGRIFEPFFTTKEVGKGTGLGLASVYGIVKQHEGWVEVESELGFGSTFRVYLPAGATPLDAPAIPGTAEGIKGGSETILLVEDELPLRRMVALCLRKLGYAVLEAGTGPEALRIWDQHHQEIQLLLTDMVMPEKMTGFELAKQLKKQKGSLQVIISSGYSVDMVGSPLIAESEITFLPKPYATPVLAKIVRRCLDVGGGRQSMIGHIYY